MRRNMRETADQGPLTPSSLDVSAPSLTPPSYHAGNVTEYSNLKVGRGRGGGGINTRTGERHILW